MSNIVDSPGWRSAMGDVANIPFLVIGNWKMNGSRQQLQDFAKSTDAVDAKGCKRVLCLPSILVPYGTEALSGKSLEIGGQDCHQETSGAYTGDTAAPMLVEAGAMAKPTRWCASRLKRLWPLA